MSPMPKTKKLSKRPTAVYLTMLAEDIRRADLSAMLTLVIEEGEPTVVVERTGTVTRVWRHDETGLKLEYKFV